MTVETELILLLAVIFLSTFIRATAGFGDAVIAMPLLAVLIGLKRAVPLIALVALTIAVSILLRNWKRVELKSAWRLIMSSILGIPLGIYFLKGAYEREMKIVLAVIVIGFGLLRLIRPALIHLKNDKPAFLFGFAAGVLGGAYNTNGPAVVAYGSMRRWPAQSFRATLQAYFLLTNIFIVSGHAAAGLWTKTVLKDYFFALPVVIAAILLGGRLHRRIPEGRFDRIIHCLLILLGLFLLLNI